MSLAGEGQRGGRGVAKAADVLGNKRRRSLSSSRRSRISGSAVVAINQLSTVGTVAGDVGRVCVSRKGGRTSGGIGGCGRRADWWLPKVMIIPREEKGALLCFKRYGTEEVFAAFVAAGVGQKRRGADWPGAALVEPAPEFNVYVFPASKYGLLHIWESGISLLIRGRRQDGGKHQGEDVNKQMECILLYRKLYAMHYGH